VAGDENSVSGDLEWAWAHQRVWSHRATELKRRLDQARTVALILALGAAVLAAAAAQTADPAPAVGRVLAAAAAISAGIGTLVQRRLGTDRVRAWTRARSASEGLKTEVYSYLAGATAYADRSTRDKILAERTRTMVEDVADLQRESLGILPDSKPLPRVTGLADYLIIRVDHQIENYYRRNAGIYERRVRRLRRLGDILGVITVILGAVAASFDLPAVAVWIPAATTAGASLVAFIAAARYDHMIIEYLRTAQRLEDLRHSRGDAPSTAPELIQACEAAISTENQGWMARWNDNHASSAESSSSDL
jgi:protein-S-isoprenylcysteine O-methyltransferase Ste14